MKKCIKNIMMIMLVVSMLGTVAYAGSATVSGTFKVDDYGQVSGYAYKSTLGAQATMSITRNVGNNVYLNDSSFQVLFRAVNTTDSGALYSTVGTITYPSASGKASYYLNQSYNINYFASAKLGPTSRYSAISLSGGTFTP